jgi:hypothetical protein
VLGQLFERDFIGSTWGRALWIKILLVLVALQIAVGNRPSRMVYAYWTVVFVIIGISVMLVRPILL